MQIFGFVELEDGIHCYVQIILEEILGDMIHQKGNKKQAISKGVRFSSDSVSI